MTTTAVDLAAHTCTVCGTEREADNADWTFHWTNGFTVAAAQTCSDGCAATYEANVR